MKSTLNEWLCAQAHDRFTEVDEKHLLEIFECAKAHNLSVVEATDVLDGRITLDEAIKAHVNQESFKDCIVVCD